MDTAEKLGSTEGTADSSSMFWSSDHPVLELTTLSHAQSWSSISAPRPRISDLKRAGQWSERQQHQSTIPVQFFRPRPTDVYIYIYVISTEASFQAQNPPVSSGFLFANSYSPGSTSLTEPFPPYKLSMNVRCDIDIKVRQLKIICPLKILFFPNIQTLMNFFESFWGASVSPVFVAVYFTVSYLTDSGPRNCLELIEDLNCCSRAAQILAGSPVRIALKNKQKRPHSSGTMNRNELAILCKLFFGNKKRFKLTTF